MSITIKSGKAEGEAGSYELTKKYVIYKDRPRIDVSHAVKVNKNEDADFMFRVHNEPILGTAAPR